MTLDLAKLRAETLALIDGTTPGPWDGVGLTVYDTCLDGVASCHTGADARLIAATPTLAADTLRLLDEVERLRAALHEMVQLGHAEAWEADYGGPHEDRLTAAMRAARAALSEGGPDDR